MWNRFWLQPLNLFFIGDSEFLLQKDIAFEINQCGCKRIF